MFNKNVESKRIFFLSLLLLMILLLPVSAAAAYGNLFVIIDPSHGGTDPGVQLSNDVNEKDVTLAIALMIQRELASTQSIRVQLTRNSEKMMTIQEREQVVRNAAPDLFISLHINSGFGKKASGFEIFFPGFRGQAQNQSGDSSVILKDMERNKYLNDSVRLAYILQKNLEQVFPRRGRGLREASIPLLDGLSKPSLIVELGFASNPEDRKKLMDREIQAAIAKAISKSIREIF